MLLEIDFLKKKGFIDRTLKEECEKGRITENEVINLYKFKSKKLA